MGERRTLESGASDLITRQRFGMTGLATLSRVSRYRKDGPSKGRVRSPYFRVPEVTESEEDRMDESDDSSFQDPSTPDRDLQQEEPATSQDSPEAGEADRGSSSESESRKRPRDPSPTGEEDTSKRGRPAARGRPIGAGNLPKFRFGTPQGESPFAIARGQQGAPSPLPSSQPGPASRGRAEQGGQHPSTQ